MSLIRGTCYGTSIKLRASNLRQVVGRPERPRFRIHFATGARERGVGLLREPCCCEPPNLKAIILNDRKRPYPTNQPGNLSRCLYRNRLMESMSTILKKGRCRKDDPKCH